MWRHGLVPPSGPRRRGHDPRHAQAAQHGSTWSTGPLGCRRGPKLGSAPAWAKYAGQQQTEGSYQKGGGRLYRQSSASPSKKEAHHHRRRRRIRQEQQGIQQTRSYDNWRQAALGVSVCSHRHQSKEVAVRGRATETESETETETASINSRKPLRAGNPSKSYLRIWAGNPESVVPGSALIRFCVQDSHSHNPLLGRKSRVSRAFYLGCWAGNRVSHPRFCAGQPE